MSADDDLRRALALGPRPSLAEREAEEAAAAAAHERAWRRKRRNGWLLTVGLIAVVSLAAAFLLVRRPDPKAVGIAPAGPSPTGPAGTLPADLSAAAFDPSGVRLAGVDADGRLGLVEEGRFRPLTPEGTVIAAFAWRTTDSLILQEGPGATGELAVIGLDGRLVRAIALEPRIPTGTSLVVVGEDVLVSAPERSEGGLGPVLVRLHAVDVRTGATRPVGAAGDVGSGRLAAVGGVVAAPGPRPGELAKLVDVAAGTTADLALGGPPLGAIDVPEPAIVTVDGGRLVAVTPKGARRTLGSLPDGRALAVDADGRRVLLDPPDGPPRIVEL